nr:MULTISPECIES: sulfonate ABC transporter substrate-binding protein [unclassified Leptolyngbya]
MSRRRSLQTFAYLFVTGLGLSTATAGCSPTSESSAPTASPAATSSQDSAASAKTLRIGYQKSSTALNLLKTKQSLEPKLGKDGISVTWNEFAAGPQMLEALNVGSIDFAYTGETPPVFAQAAGAPLVYVAYEPVGPAAEAILVQSDSPIQSVAELKGKRVALNKGSNVHYLLVRALEEAGLKYTDIEVAYLPPGDARPAFEQKSVDAWVIWDPFQAAAETAVNARILQDGQGLVENRGFFLSTKSFTENNPAIVRSLLDELNTISDWAKANPSEVSAFLNKELGIDKAALDKAESRRGYGVKPMDATVIEGQQKIADTFLELNLIPQKIDIASVIWNG